MAKIVIIDGNSLLFRSYYATYNPDPNLLMHNKEGVPTNAVFAFSNMIVSLIMSLNKDDGIFVAFDKGKHTFRHKKFKDYKANRSATPPELLAQMPIARKFLDALNILYYEDDEIEADDIAGIMAKKAEQDGYKVLMYTSDKDYLQLIDDNITIKLIKRGLKDIHEMTPTSFKEEWGFDPINIIDYKGLMGDPSDNLKGIPSIGDIRAKQLIIKYGNFEGILDHVDELTPNLKKNLTEFQEQGKLCKELAIINTSFPIPYSPKETIYAGYHLTDVDKFASAYDLRNLTHKLPSKLRINEIQETKLTSKEVTTLDALKDIKELGISVDTSEDNYHYCVLFGMGFTAENENYYITFENLIKDKTALKLLADSSVKKYCFDYKKIKCVLTKNNIELNGLYFDLLLATYLTEASVKTDINSVLSFYGIDINYAFQNTNLFTTSNSILAAVNSYYPVSLYEKIITKLMELNQFKLLNEIELPLTEVLADMEIEGFPCDSETLLSFGEEYKKTIDANTRAIYKYAGHEFNINSTRELANVLYNELQLKDNKKHSTSIEYLEELAEDHPIIKEIINYRKYSKLLSTYINGLIPYIGKDNKIHATFNQAITQTGRLSSSEPNLQNISIRDEDGKQIRKAFFYIDPDLYLLSLDYSQIELRILASLSNCKKLIDIFNDGGDIHASTAKIIFHLDKEPTHEQRRQAKAVNFGIVYGISDWGLAEQIGVRVNEAKAIIQAFNESFPEVKEYLNSLIDTAIKNGYATTMFNRRRYLPELQNDNYAVREFAKRAAMNAPIQGSAADLIKIAMINTNKALKENGFKAKIVSQIHDELIIKVNNEEKDKVLKLVKETMENCVKFNVNLIADGGYAKTWFDAK